MIKTLLSNIKESILADENFKLCLIYPNARCDVIAPAVFLEISNYFPGDDPATGELSLIANVEARVVVDTVSEESELACQSLAHAVAHLAHLNSFGCNVSPAKIIGISRDAFKPEFDAYICWLIEWQHELHVGQAVTGSQAVPGSQAAPGRDVLKGELT